METANRASSKVLVGHTVRKFPDNVVITGDWDGDTITRGEIDYGQGRGYKGGLHPHPTRGAVRHGRGRLTLRNGVVVAGTDWDMGRLRYGVLKGHGWLYMGWLGKDAKPRGAGQLVKKHTTFVSDSWRGFACHACAVTTGGRMFCTGVDNALRWKAP